MIPKRIYYCWFGNQELPEADRKNLEGWKKFCPDYEIIRLDETNCEIQKNRYTEQAYQNLMWGFVPDFIRLDVIYRTGGIYFDTDVELRSNLDFLLKNRAFMGFESKKWVNLGHGFGSEPGNRIIKEMLDIYEELDFTPKDGTRSLLPSPAYTTGVLLKHGLRRNNRLQRVEDITVYPSCWFCPKNYLTGRLHVTPETVSIHHFHASWFSAEKKQELEHARKIRNTYGIRFGNVFLFLEKVVVVLKNGGFKVLAQRAGKKRKNLL